jgi:hypothetical protein
MFTFLNPKRKVVIEHNITSNIDGERFAPVVIDGHHWGADFDLYNGDTLIHDDGMYGNIPVTFHQTFLTTSKSDELLLHKYRNK